MNVLDRCIGALLFFGSLGTTVLPLQESVAAGPTVGPSINFSRAAGKQYETSVAINGWGWPWERDVSRQCLGDVLE